MPVPSATYRVQFSLNFRFVDAEKLVPYLHRLGISHLYASPRFRARKGSSHGYDVADPVRVNSELGTEEEFQALVKKLEHYGMGLLLDIVPNHMVASEENPWWMDVLENGQNSQFAGYFDIDWSPCGGKTRFLQQGRVLLPVLGDLYGKVLRKRELALHLDDRGIFLMYGKMRFPLSPESYSSVLTFAISETRSETQTPAIQEALEKIQHACETLPVCSPGHPDWSARRRVKVSEIKENLWQLCRSEPACQQLLDRTLHTINGESGVPESFETLDAILSRQFYRLAYWRTATHEINYRRFFDVSDLLGVRVENPLVFHARHDPIARLVEAGEVQGLRVDHIDGLRDPFEYLHRLLEVTKFGEPQTAAYTVVEKILCGSESLPPDWPVDGTTGYDFVNAANLLFVHEPGYRALQEHFECLTGDAAPFESVWREGKKQVMRELFHGEVLSLGQRLASLAAADRQARDLPVEELRWAFQEVTAALSIYRTYVHRQELPLSARLAIGRAIRDASQNARNPVQCAALSFFRRLFNRTIDAAPGNWEAEWLEFVMRWQMFTGAVMAKGFEDTTFYVYTPLVSLNEVGASPFRHDRNFGVEPFHEFLKSRQEKWPHTMNATSTHDTKRSEDVRARIHIISEMPREWTASLTRWMGWNRKYKSRVEGLEAPAPSEELLLYQTLIGAWPVDDAHSGDFEKRILGFMGKAMREAKQFTDWLSPNEAHEKAVRQFISKILEPDASPRFLGDLQAFFKRVALPGALNSLSQALLKIAAPGIPDFYQGSEILDFSLTDPDNRRPVDFEKRANLLDETLEAAAGDRAKFCKEILENWKDSRIKLFLTTIALQFRRSHAELFAEGSYEPLRAKGQRSENVCSFLRRHKKEWVLTAVPRFTSDAVDHEQPGINPAKWKDSRLMLPPRAPLHWVNVFTEKPLNTKGTGSSKWLTISDLFADLPFALLAGSSLKPKQTHEEER